MSSTRTPGLPDGIAAATVGRDLGIPVVVTEHASTIETELADPAALDRYRTLLEPGARLLAVSPPVAARLAGLLGVAGRLDRRAAEPGRRRAPSCAAEPGRP